MICWHSQSLPLLLLLMLTIHQGLSNQLACNYSTIVDSMIDLKTALAKGMKSFSLIHMPSKEECLEKCCTGLPIRRGNPCNFVTFHPTGKQTNCYLFYCSEKDACPMIPLTGYNSYIIENDQTNVETLNITTKNSQSGEKSSNNGIPNDSKTSAPGLTLSQRTINILPLTTIHSRIKQPVTATTFKAPMILLLTSSTKTTSSIPPVAITQLPVKTTSSVTTKESTATSTLQNGLLLTSAKTVPTTVFPILQPTQTRTAALPTIPSVTSMLAGTVLTTTTQAITTITTKPLATTTLQTTSTIQPTMTTAPPSTLQTTSSQSTTTTLTTTTNQPTTTTLPITTNQPTTSTLPTTTNQPTTTTLPITTDQPTTSTLPTTTLTTTTNQPTTTTLPITTDQLTTSTLPTTNQPTTSTLPTTTNQPTTTTLPTTIQTTPIQTTMTTTFPTTTAQPAMRTTLLIHQITTTTAQLKTTLPETRPMTTITTVSARKLNSSVTQQPTQSRNSAAKTPFFQIKTAVSNNGDTNKKDDEEKDPRQNLGGQNESAGKFGDSQMEIKGGLITALLFGLLFLTIVIIVLSKRVIESYRRRHYTKMDFVMNGIYVDA